MMRQSNWHSGVIRIVSRSVHMNVYDAALQTDIVPYAAL